MITLVNFWRIWRKEKKNFYLQIAFSFFLFLFYLFVSLSL